jgi:hypothetical protein
MRLKFFIIPAALVIQVAHAQDPASFAVSQGTGTPVSSASSTTVTPPSTGLVEISIIDYKSVYEAATLEEEVQMATERFKLTKSQQEVWAGAAVDRREIEKLTRAKLESKVDDYSKTDVYKGLRSAQNQFYETIIGYFDPTQKQLMERERVIMDEKRKMIAKLPPPVIAPTVTVAPIDSAAIYESQKSKKAKAKAKPKKKKQAIGT